MNFGLEPYYGSYISCCLLWIWILVFYFIKSWKRKMLVYEKSFRFTVIIVDGHALTLCFLFDFAVLLRRSRGVPHDELLLILSHLNGRIKLNMIFCINLNNIRLYILILSKLRNFFITYNILYNLFIIRIKKLSDKIWNSNANSNKELPHCLFNSSRILKFMPGPNLITPLE